MARLPRIKPREEVGHDPDYRFTLANERTFLAWIRTSLAMIAGGLAVYQFVPDLGGRTGRALLGTTLTFVGTVVAMSSILRWAATEEAMRQDRPIPSTLLPAFIAIGVVVIAGIVAALLLTG